MSSPTLDKATVQLVPKPNTTSPVWKHFAVEVDEKGKVKNDEEVVCQLCSKKVVAKGSNTSNLIAHLCVHHPLQYTDYQSVQRLQKERTEKVNGKGGGKGNDEKQTTIISNIEKLKKYDRSSKKVEASDKFSDLLSCKRYASPLYSRKRGVPKAFESI